MEVGALESRPVCRTRAIACSKVIGAAVGIERPSSRDYVRTFQLGTRAKCACRSNIDIIDWLRTDDPTQRFSLHLTFAAAIFYV